MTTLIWDGVAQLGEAPPGDEGRMRHALADAAKRYDWRSVVELLDESPHLVNTTRPGGASLFTPLHQAAYGNAPGTVVRELVTRGGWLTQENARGERPIDVAIRRGHRELAVDLEPCLVRQVPSGVLLKIQQHFHAVIRREVSELVDRFALRLPELQPLLEVERDKDRFFFQVPGMLGGYFYRLAEEGVAAKLAVIESSRMGGSTYYDITSAGSELVGEGP